MCFGLLPSGLSYYTRNRGTIKIGILLSGLVASCSRLHGVSGVLHYVSNAAAHAKQSLIAMLTPRQQCTRRALACTTP